MSEKVVWKARRERLAGEGRIVQWDTFSEIHSIKGFNGQYIVLAAEKAQMIVFAPRDTSLGSEKSC